MKYLIVLLLQGHLLAGFWPDPVDSAKSFASKLEKLQEFFVTIENNTNGYDYIFYGKTHFIKSAVSPHTKSVLIDAGKTFRGLREVIVIKIYPKSDEKDSLVSDYNIYLSKAKSIQKVLVEEAKILPKRIRITFMATGESKKIHHKGDKLLNAEFVVSASAERI